MTAVYLLFHRSGGFYMSAISNLTERDLLVALGLDHVSPQSLEILHSDDGICVHITLNPMEQTCPCCGQKTSRIKGYVTKKITHSIFQPMEGYIIYNARRYVCTFCRTTFYENNPFSYKGTRISVATVYNVLQELKKPTATFTSVASLYNLSPSSVSNIFDRNVSMPRRTLPECICIDETYAFSSDDSNYVCVLLDYKNQKIIDVLPTRRKDDLYRYFGAIPLEEREKVLFVSFDMWKTYRVVAKKFFPNCKCVVDKFHLMQELLRTLHKVRTSIMNDNYRVKEELKKKARELKKDHKSLEPDEQEILIQASHNYYLLKKFSYLLYSNNPKGLDPNREKKYNTVLECYLNLYDIRQLLLSIDPLINDADNAFFTMSNFYKKNTSETAKKELEFIITTFRQSNIPGLQKYSNTLTEWKSEILNSFCVIPGTNRKMTNALIENKNKTIKLIKHSANGYRDWERFRKRVLYCLNSDEGPRQ